MFRYIGKCFRSDTQQASKQMMKGHDYTIQEALSRASEFQGKKANNCSWAQYKI